MDVQQLLAKLAEQREGWASLPDGKRLKFRRPQEVDLPALAAGVRLQHVIDCACGWEGFTEADLLGAAVGSSDPLPFHPDLWAAVVKDRAHYIGPVASAIAAAVTAYLESRDAATKN
jgi:hypothetical protein